MKNTQLFIIGIFTILLFGAASANAATWTVTKFENSNDNVCDADCSLREAVFNADSGDTVVFNSNLAGQQFTLGGSEIVITKRIIIDGQLNPSVAFITGSNTSRIFLIEAGGALDLRNAGLQSGNSATSAFDAGRGSAISAKQSASLSLNRVWVRNNTATVGAIVVRTGTHHITNSSFTTNTASTCLAIYNQDANANLYMANVTLTGNYDPGGDLGGSGTICNSGNLTIRNSTITANVAEVDGGGIFNTTGGILNLGNTIVAQNSAPGNAQDILAVNGSTVISVGGNLIGDTDGTPAGTFMQPNDITGVNPLLAPTNAGQGGFPVVTHPLQAGSPARNGGLNANAVDPLTNLPLTTDGRGVGFPRIADTTVDIGAFEDQSGNTSLIVSKNANSNDLVCDVDCSLREAVHQASLNFGTDTITFANNVIGTIPLGGSEILIQNHNVNIVSITNLNSDYRIISGENTSRVFRLNNATVNISGLTLANGNAGVDFGGAILSENGSNLTLDKMIVRNNFAAAYGAIFLSGGTGRITNSTISNNSANTGLAIGVSGTLNMANTTVSSNFDADGGTGIGAIYNTGTLNIRNSTIAFNRTSGGTGGGIFNGGTLNIGNTIVSNNIALVSPDIHQSSGMITSVGGNLVQNTSGFPMGTFSQTNDAVNVDPMLEGLTDNGGNVTTHSLMVGSPATDSGINDNAIDPFDFSPLTTDARGAGYSRIISVVDKGAFELQIPLAANVSISGRVTVGKQGLSNAQVVLTDLYGNRKILVTGSFGYYRFDELAVGETYFIQVFSKRYQFNPQAVTPFEDLSEINFTANEED